MERRRQPGTPGGRQRLPGRAARRLGQPRLQLRGGRGGGRAHRALSQELLPLRDAGLRHRLPHRRLLQARRGRRRAGRLRQVHRLQAVRLGLPLRRPRARRGGRHHEEVHAVHRPDLQRDPAGGGAPARLCPCLPEQGPPFRRLQRPELDGVEAQRRARRLPFDGGARPAADRHLPAAAAGPARRGRGAGEGEPRRRPFPALDRHDADAGRLRPGLRGHGAAGPQWPRCAARSAIPG